MFTWNQLLSVYQPGLDALVSRIRVTPSAIAVEAARRQEDPNGPYAGLPVKVANGVARVDVGGVLYKGAPAWARVYGFSATERIAQGVLKAASDPDVDSILLEVDSPGGSVDGLSELGDAIRTARQRKSVIAGVDGMAASAAYYAASQANEIVAERTSLIGSIGTRMLLYDFSKMFEEEGIKAIPIDTGEYKSAGALGTEITENQQADFQRIVDGYFADFVNMVSSGRNASEKKIREEWGTGQVWMAGEAMSMGLINRIATGEQTVALLEKQARDNAERKAAEGRRSSLNQKGRKAMSENNDTATPAAPVAATLSELKANFPASSAEWREQCLEQGLTLIQCKDAWIRQLENQAAEAGKKLAEQSAKVAQLEAAAKTKGGIEPLATGKPAAAAEGGDVREQIRSLVDERMRETGKPRYDCHAMVMREHRELREALVAASNADRRNK